jgi:protein CpxP
LLSLQSLDAPPLDDDSSFFVSAQKVALPRVFSIDSIAIFLAQLPHRDCVYTRNGRPAQGPPWEKNKMNNMSKATIALGVLLSAGSAFALAQAPDSNSSAASAEPGQHRTFDPGRQAAHLGQRLGLTSDQVAQIKPILADRFQKMQTLRADNSLNQQDRHTKVQAIMQDSNSKIEALLSDNQKQQFEQMQAQRRSHQHNRQAPPQA